MPLPDRYCFERGVAKTGAGRGFADVWKRDCFAWEYKAPPVPATKRNDAVLDGALRQLIGCPRWRSTTRRCSDRGAEGLADDEILRRLLALNRERSAVKAAESAPATPA